MLPVIVFLMRAGSRRGSRERDTFLEVRLMPASVGKIEPDTGRDYVYPW